MIVTSCYFAGGSGGGCGCRHVCVLCVCVPPFFADVRLFICCDFTDVVDLLMLEFLFTDLL